MGVNCNHDLFRRNLTSKATWPCSTKRKCLGRSTTRTSLAQRPAIRNRISFDNWTSLKRNTDMTRTWSSRCCCSSEMCNLSSSRSRNTRQMSRASSFRRSHSRCATVFRTLLATTDIPLNAKTISSLVALLNLLWTFSVGHEGFPRRISTNGRVWPSFATSLTTSGKAKSDCPLPASSLHMD